MRPKPQKHQLHSCCVVEQTQLEILLQFHLLGLLILGRVTDLQLHFHQKHIEPPRRLLELCLHFVLPSLRLVQLTLFHEALFAETFHVNP